MRLGRHTTSSRRDERGAAMLELSLVVPVLLTIGLGAIEFGRLIYEDHLVFNGVRDAGRYLSGLPYDPSNTTQTTTNNTAAKNIAVYGVTGSGTARVNGWLPGHVSISYGTIANSPTSCGSSKCYRGGDAVYTVTVSATVPYTSFGFLGYLGFGSKNLVSSHQERIYGVR